MHLSDDRFDPIGSGMGDRMHGFIQAMIEGKLEAAPPGRAMSAADKRASFNPLVFQKRPNTLQIAANR